MWLAILFLLTLRVDAGCVEVNVDRILGRHLATILPGLERVPPEEVVAFMAVPGTPRVIRVEEQRRIARRFGIDLELTEDVCFVTPVEPLSPKEVERAIREVIGADVRIHVAELSKFPVPRGELRFKTTGLAIGPRPSPSTPVFWNGAVLYGENKSMAIWARVTLAERQRVLLVSKMLAPGAIIDKAVFDVVEQDVFPFPRHEELKPESLIGRVVRRALKPGDVLRDSYLEPRVDVARGSKVRVQVHGPGTMLSFEAQAQTSASIGQRVSLRSAINGVLFQGEVDGVGTAIVKVSPR